MKDEEAMAENGRSRALDDLNRAKQLRTTAVEKASKTAIQALKKDTSKTKLAAASAAKNERTMVNNANMKESIYEAAKAIDIEWYHKRMACVSELEYSQREELFAMLEVIRLENGGVINTALRIVFPFANINTAKKWYPSHHSLTKWNLPESRRGQLRSAYTKHTIQ